MFVARNALKNKEIQQEVSERFFTVRKTLGLTQADMAARLGMSARNYRFYEAGDYDDPKKQTPLIKAVINKIDAIQKELDTFPTQKGDNNNIVQSMERMAEEMKLIRERMERFMSTIESQTRIIESLTQKS